MKTAQAFAVGLLTMTGLVGCSQPNDAYCEVARTEFDLSFLGQAIASKDNQKITDAMARLQKLRDVAPEEIYNDLDQLLDTLVLTIRAVTRTTGGDGTAGPVEIADLNRRLATAGESSQRVTAFTTAVCGITATTTTPSTASGATGT